jgi:hypothetical protein
MQINTLRRLIIILTFTLAGVAFGTSALAQPVDESRGKELAGEAMAFYKDGEFEQALEKFKEAKALYPTAQVLRMTGYTLMAMERWLEAATILEEALGAEFKPLLPRDAEHAQDNLKEVVSHLAQVEVISGVAGAKVMVDGQERESLPAKLILEPGVHTFVVTADEHDHADTEKDVQAGQKITIELDPTPLASGEVAKPLPKPKPKPEPVDEPSDIYGWFPHQGPIGLATAGLGVGFGVAALITGVAGTSLRSAVQENINAHNANYDATCSQNSDQCLNDIALINSDGTRAQGLQDAGVGLGIMSAVLFTVGTVLFLFSDDSPLAPSGSGDGPDSVSMSCGPSASHVGGAFACFGRF